MSTDFTASIFDDFRKILGSVEQGIGIIAHRAIAFHCLSITFHQTAKYVFMLFRFVYSHFIEKVIERQWNAPLSNSPAKSSKMLAVKIRRH